ncbi:unnamed protein product [Ectocarpus fasciculatus]
MCSWYRRHPEERSLLRHKLRLVRRFRMQLKGRRRHILLLRCHQIQRKFVQLDGFSTVRRRPLKRETCLWSSTPARQAPSSGPRSRVKATSFRGFCCLLCPQSVARSLCRVLRSIIACLGKFHCAGVMHVLSGKIYMSKQKSNIGRHPTVQVQHAAH